jgi:hypothetical protein
MAESACTPPYLTHQSDEKGRLETYVVALEGQMARLAELEAALGRMAEATTGAPKEEGSEAECQHRVTCQRVRIAAAAAPDDQGRAAQSRGQLTSNQSEARQNRRIDSTGVTEGYRVRPHRPARIKKVTRHRPNRQRGPPGPVPP